MNRRPLTVQALFVFAGALLLAATAGYQPAHADPGYLRGLLEHGAGLGSRTDQSVSWTLVPTAPVIPGVLVDPEPKVIQDSGLNSSFVVKFTRGGQPIPNAAVAWDVDDPTARIQAPFANTDSEGLARAWLIAGTATRQVVTVRASDPSLTASFTVQRSGRLPRTVGRYVTLYLDAPLEARNAEQVWVGVTPHTAPTRTYYQLATAWTKTGPVSFYGGLQKLPCPDTSTFPLREACAKSRGSLRGNVVLFSMWDARGSNGGAVRPRTVSVPPSTKCQRFDHEGDGLQCMAAVDWRIDRRLDWRVERMPTAEGQNPVLKVTTSIDGGRQWRHFGTFEVPLEPDMASIAAFNENWGGAPARTCQQVAIRDMSINSVRFGIGSSWFPADWALAAGSLYPGALPCLNYGVVAVPGHGIRMTSGGATTWVDLRVAAMYDGADMPFGMGFRDADQVANLYQQVSTSTLK